MDKVANFWQKIITSKTRVMVVLLAFVVFGLFGWKAFGQEQSTPKYQTAQAEKGNLIISISASGTVAAGNSVDITTNASGVVTKVYVANGDSVVEGQKIADIQLDQDSQQKQASAYATYLQAKNTLDAANAKLNSLQAAEFSANQKFINDAVERELANNDPTYIQENAAWLQSEADYKNQQGVISQAQASLNNSALSMQQISSTVTAPTAGVITSLTLAPGSVISSGQSNNSSSNTSSSKIIGTVTLENSQLQALVNLSEIDIPNVKPGQKVTMTLDAFPGKTFTGRVAAINTNGAVSSGVTTYPVTINFDTALSNIYPNMAVNATVITDIKNNVLLVSSSAVQTINGQSTVRVLKNGQVTPIPVEIGSSNDTQTEIISGLNEGDTTVTGTITQKTSGQGTSLFGGGNRNFGGGGGVMVRRGG